MSNGATRKDDDNERHVVIPISLLFYLSSGVIFPEQFYTFLKNYMSKFAMLPVLTADEKISRCVLSCCQRGTLLSSESDI